MADILPFMGNSNWYQYWYARASDPIVNSARYDAKASVAMGDTVTLMNQSEMSFYWYQRANTDVPNDPDIMKRLGAADLRSGKIQDADQIYSSILASNQNDTDALRTEGIVLANEGNFTGAVADYDQILAQNPNDASTLNLKGDALLLYSIVQQQAALQSAAHSISQNPEGNPSAQSSISVNDFSSYQEAIQSYEQAMKINPALALPITAKILGVTSNQINEYDSILNNMSAA
jgi:tetratricopeptide (TPR) repeat protein